MKHLKTYENINTLYKKYAVFMKLDSSKQLNLIQIIGDDNQNLNEKIVVFRVLFTYDKERDIFLKLKTNKTHSFYREYADKRILFSSDNIKECEEQIKLLSTSNKYNL